MLSAWQKKCCFVPRTTQRLDLIIFFPINLLYSIGTVFTLKFTLLD
jgi:hypothetical protein